MAEVKPRASTPCHDEKGLVRKIDRHVLPLLFVACMLQFLDKTALSSTGIFGIQESLHLSGNQFSWASSAFYFGYLVASYPVSLGFVKFPLGKFLSLSFVAWAVVVACHGAVSNFAGLVAVRVLLGALESTMYPGFSLVTGLWYKRAEHTSRHAIWASGNSTAAIFSGLLAYGIGHIRNSLEPWRWIFIIYGIMTFTFGIAFFLLMPDSPRDARFLCQEEQEYAHKRTQQETHTTRTYAWSRRQFIEALVDPKTWLLFVYVTASTTPSSALANFGSIIIAGFGFSPFNTVLLLIPASVISLLWLLLAALITSHVRKSRCLTLAALMALGIVGGIVILEVGPGNKMARLGGLWIFSAVPVALPTMQSLVASNVAGYTKKTTVSAIVFIGYCTGGIIGPLLFLPREAPRYQSAWIGYLIAASTALVSILGLRVLMDFENRRRDRRQNVRLDPEGPGVTPTGGDIALDKDETDWENPRFRYVL